jgi:hypothetical protein
MNCDWDNDLSKVEVGDYIATIRFGWVKVFSISVNDEHPVETTCESFLFNGRYTEYDIAPSAFTRPPEWLLILIGPKPHTFRRDEVILVSDNNIEWYPRHFIEWTSDGYKCVADGLSIKTMRGEQITYWEYAKKYE